MNNDQVILAVQPRSFAIERPKVLFQPVIIETLPDCFDAGQFNFDVPPVKNEDQAVKIEDDPPMSQ